MSALSRCLLPCPRKDAKCEFPFEMYSISSIGESSASRCRPPRTWLQRPRSSPRGSRTPAWP
eukprot:8719659-Heterocapsa_arctica.AAC.1